MQANFETFGLLVPVQMSAFYPKRTFLDQQLATVDQNQGERLEPKILSVL